MYPEYVIDSRSPFGYDIPPTLFFGEPVNVNLNGVFLYRTYTNSYGAYFNSRLIDANNTGFVGESIPEESDNALSIGREFYDPALGVRVKARKLTNGKFRVSIDKGSVICTTFPPVIKKEKIFGFDSHNDNALYISNADEYGILYTAVIAEIYIDDYRNCYNQTQLINTISIDGQTPISPNPNWVTPAYTTYMNNYYNFTIDTAVMPLGSHIATLTLTNTFSGLSASVDILFTLVP